MSRPGNIELGEGTYGNGTYGTGTYGDSLPDVVPIRVAASASGTTLALAVRRPHFQLAVTSPRVAVAALTAGLTISVRAS